MNEGTESVAAQTWRERITAQQAGRQSIRALCKENGWHEHAFYWWRARLGLSPRPLARHRRKRIGQPGFAEVVVDRPGITHVAALADPICLRLYGGRELVLPASMPLEQVATLVRQIESRS